jgi:hypothetical protein
MARILGMSDDTAWVQLHCSNFGGPPPIIVGTSEEGDQRAGSWWWLNQAIANGVRGHRQPRAVHHAWLTEQILIVHTASGIRGAEFFKVVESIGC